MRPKLLLLLLSAAAIAACSVPTQLVDEDEVLLRTDRRVYLHGDTLEVQFINDSDEPVGYGACSGSLQRLEKGRWEEVYPETRPCIDILYVLEPGRRQISRQPIDPSLSPGSYRLRRRILPGTSLPERSIFSPPLAIRARE